MHGFTPFEIHFVWVWGGNVGKKTRMREQQYFIDPPPYYRNGVFLSFDVQPIAVRGAAAGESLWRRYCGLGDDGGSMPCCLCSSTGWARLSGADVVCCAIRRHSPGPGWLQRVE